jgi:hypothetical protein
MFMEKSNIQERHLIITDSWNVVLVQCRLSMLCKYIYKKNAQLAATVAYVDICLKFGVGQL